MLHVTPTIALEDREVEEQFVRASGPGGQNVNKVSTAVQLRLDLGASSLPDYVKARVRELFANRVTNDDVLVIDAREHRTQGQNREAARARLVGLLQAAAHRPKRRRASKPTASSRERRLVGKVKRAAVKAGRRREKPDGGD
jgi:ribosome-associated protein